MTKEEALKQFAQLGAVWFGNSKQHFAFSAYCRLQGWNKLADKWKEEAEEEWDEAEGVLNRLVELGCKPADLQEAMKTIEFPFYDDPKQQIESDYGLGSPVSALHREARLREFPHRDDVEGRMDQVFKSRRPLVCRDFLDKSRKK